MYTNLTSAKPTRKIVQELSQHERHALVPLRPILIFVPPQNFSNLLPAMSHHRTAPAAAKEFYSSKDFFKLTDPQ